MQSVTSVSLKIIIIIIYTSTVHAKGSQAMPNMGIIQALKPSVLWLTLTSADESLTGTHLQVIFIQNN